jgi:hypothetical protein
VAGRDQTRTIPFGCDHSATPRLVLRWPPPSTMRAPTSMRLGAFSYRTGPRPTSRNGADGKPARLKNIAASIAARACLLRSSVRTRAAVYLPGLRQRGAGARPRPSIHPRELTTPLEMFSSRKKRSAEAPHVVLAGRSDHFNALPGSVLRRDLLVLHALRCDQDGLRNHDSPILSRRAMSDYPARRHHHGFLDSTVLWRHDLALIAGNAGWRRRVAATVTSCGRDGWECHSREGRSD